MKHSVPTAAAVVPAATTSPARNPEIAAKRSTNPALPTPGDRICRLTTFWETSLDCVNPRAPIKPNIPVLGTVTRCCCVSKTLVLPPNQLSCSASTCLSPYVAMHTPTRRKHSFHPRRVKTGPANGIQKETIDEIIFANILCVCVCVCVVW